MTLKERIQKVRSEMRKIVKLQEDLYNRAMAEGRSLTADEEEQYSKADADWLELQKEEQRLVELDEKMQRVAEQNKDVNLAAPNVDATIDYRQAFLKYLQYGVIDMTAEERRVLRNGYADVPDVQKRAQTITGSGGGYLIPQDMRTELEVVMAYYGPMNTSDVVMKIVTASGNTLTWPTVDDTNNIGSSVDINTTVSAQDLTFGQLSLTAYKYTSNEVVVPYELMQDEAVGLENYIVTALGERLGRIVNQKLTVGTGTNEPTGIATAAGTGATAASATAITRADIIDLIHSVDPAYRVGPKVGFMFNDAILAAIKKLSIGSADDRPLWQVSMRENEPDRLEGFRYWVNNDMEGTIATGKKTMLFGDFGKYIFRQAGEIRMYRLEERRRLEDQTSFVGFLRIDGGLLVSSAVKALVQA